MVVWTAKGAATDVRRNGYELMEMASSKRASSMVAPTSTSNGTSEAVLAAYRDGAKDDDSLLLDLTVDPPVLRKGGTRLQLIDAPPVRRSRIAVRLFDVAVASTALLIAAPIFIAVAVWVKMTSRGPIIYRSPRIARDGGTFEALKFRTMVVDADEALERLLAKSSRARAEYYESLKLRDDPRIVRGGAFLRKSSLDELPQLLNVLRGEMSIVGPRPKLPQELPKYGRAMPTVLRVKPGLTGRWQVSGRNDTTFDERIALDVDYALTRTISNDVAICLRTARQIVNRERQGAY